VVAVEIVVVVLVAPGAVVLGAVVFGAESPPPQPAIHNAPTNSNAPVLCMARERREGGVATRDDRVAEIDPAPHPECGSGSSLLAEA
jgi:hypothetical protein